MKINYFKLLDALGLAGLALMFLEPIVPAPSRKPVCSPQPIITEVSKSESRLSLPFLSSEQLPKIVIDFLKWAGDKVVGTLVITEVTAMFNRRKNEGSKIQGEDKDISEDLVLEALEHWKRFPKDKGAEENCSQTLLIYISNDGSAAQELNQILAPYKQFEQRSLQSEDWAEDWNPLIFKKDSSNLESGDLDEDSFPETLASFNLDEEEQKDEEKEMRIALTYLGAGFSVEAVARGTGLSIKEVQQLQQQIELLGRKPQKA
jgi:hypothetical protein